MTLPSTVMLRVANSTPDKNTIQNLKLKITIKFNYSIQCNLNKYKGGKNKAPIVDFDSRLNSLRVNRDSRFDLPTPESPISTTEKEKFDKGLK
jgi:hypothetical protein